PDALPILPLATRTGRAPGRVRPRAREVERGTSGQVVLVALDRASERRPGRGAEGQLRPIGVLGVPNPDHGGEVRHFNAVAALVVAVAALTPQTCHLNAVATLVSAIAALAPVDAGQVIHSRSIAVLIAARDSSMESA